MVWDAGMVLFYGLIVVQSICDLSCFLIHGARKIMVRAVMGVRPVVLQ